MVAGCHELHHPEVHHYHKPHVVYTRTDPTCVSVDPTLYQPKKANSKTHKMEHFRVLYVIIFPYIRCMFWWR